MAEPKIYQKSPFFEEVQEGKKYAWCACGLSQKQPFCDGSHSGTGMTPIIYTAPTSKKVAFCGCKHTKNPPLCDGAHGTL